MKRQIFLKLLGLSAFIPFVKLPDIINHGEFKVPRGYKWMKELAGRKGYLICHFGRARKVKSIFVNGQEIDEYSVNHQNCRCTIVCKANDDIELGDIVTINKKGKIKKWEGK